MHQDQAALEKSTLYVVATPIGNLRDISLRALDILKQVDWIAAEDTRTSSKLLNHYGINAKLLALHEHNERASSSSVSKLLQQGKTVALISDAGTPCISDPGALLIKEVRDAGFKIVPVPGANAAVSAMSVSGLSTQQFLFYGFLPHESGKRRRELESLRLVVFPMVFYEAPHRVLETLQDMLNCFGERHIVLARELTKMFETIIDSSLTQALQTLKDDTNQQRGEFVLIVEGSSDSKVEDAQLKRQLTILLDDLPLKQAVKLLAQISGERKNKIYDLALTLKSDDNDNNFN